MKNTECGLSFFILFKLLLVINFGVELSCGTKSSLSDEIREKLRAYNNDVTKIHGTVSPTQYMRYLKLIDEWMNALHPSDEFRYDFSFNLIMYGFQ